MRRGKKVVSDDLLARDIEFRRELLRRAKEAYSVVYDYLLAVVEGRAEGEERMTAKGDVIYVKASHDVRVKAAKVLKELTMDKVVADKRDSGSEKDKGSGMDLREALLEIEKQKREEAEKRAKEQGKLAEIRR